jgi:DNA-binding NarL/FixJ family response regulator
MEVVGEAGDGSGAVDLVRNGDPDVVLMDVRMPGLDGVAATRAIVDEFGDDAPKVLVLTTFDLDESAAQAIEAGASGFVLKEAEPEFLLASVRAVAAGSQVVAAGATRRLWERFRARPTAEPGLEYESLTAREREILVRAAEGLSNAEIAEAEFLTEGTVKTHVSRILSKLGLRDRVQLVVYAFRHGLT